MGKLHLLGIGIVVALMIGLMQFPTEITTHAVEKVPKEVQERVCSQVQVEKDLIYTIVDKGKRKSFEGLNSLAVGWTKVRNTDNEPGTFTLNCHARTAENDYHPSNKKYIEPGETREITCSVDTDFFQDISFSYSIDPGTKTVTEKKCHMETKTKMKEQKVKKTKTVPLYQKILRSLKQG